MKTKVKKCWQQYFILIAILLIPVISGSSNLPALQSSCPEPEVFVTGQTAGSVSFSWSPVSGASEYVVFYVRQGDNYISQQTYTQQTSITFAGLPSGTYDFYFATVCGNTLSGIIIIEDLVI